MDLGEEDGKASGCGIVCISLKHFFILFQYRTEGVIQIGSAELSQIGNTEFLHNWYSEFLQNWEHLQNWYSKLSQNGNKEY